LLARLPRDNDNIETIVEHLAATAKLTLYQAGNVLCILGVQNVPLSRKRGSHGTQQQVNVNTAYKRWKAGVLKPLEVQIDVGNGVPEAVRAVLRTCLYVVDTPDVPKNIVRIRRGTTTKTFGFYDDSTLTEGIHWLFVLDTMDSRKIACMRAHAYTHYGIVSSVCVSYNQAAQHIVANAHSLNNPAFKASYRCRSSCNKVTGLAGILCLSRTASGTLPAVTAHNLANALLTLKCADVASLVQLLLTGGKEVLLSLKVQNVGLERAAAVYMLLIGNDK
jgi:hypothetical protein